MTPLRRAGWIITLLAAALWAVWAWRVPRKARLRLAAVLLLVAVVALALNNAAGVGVRTWTPRPVQAQLEDVAVLLAVDAHPRPDLSVAEVSLYWLALRETSQNFKAFVHLLGPDGAVIAQHDGEPVGGYTPTSRWRAGELVVDRHFVPLPPELPAGAYSLRAGLYQVEPLHNLAVSPSAADNRVDIGVLTLPEH